MIKVSDYIAKRLKETYGVRHVFMVSGGGAMHLNDDTRLCRGRAGVRNQGVQANRS